jgi:nuclear pore complex protein Nup54
VDAQVQTAQLHQQKLADLKTRLTALSERHSLSNVSRHQRATQTQMQLAYRISKLCSHLHLLIPALRASAIRPEEEALRAALDSLSQEIRGPGASNAGIHHMGRLRARLNELWALLGAAQAAHERGKGKDARWTVVDEDGLREIAQVIANLIALCLILLNCNHRSWATSRRAWLISRGYCRKTCGIWRLSRVPSREILKREELLARYLR